MLLMECTNEKKKHTKEIQDRKTIDLEVKEVRRWIGCGEGRCRLGNS